MIPLNGVS